MLVNLGVKQMLRIKSSFLNWIELTESIFKHPEKLILDGVFQIPFLVHCAPKVPILQ